MREHLLSSKSSGRVKVMLSQQFIYIGMVEIRVSRKFALVCWVEFTMLHLMFVLGSRDLNQPFSPSGPWIVLLSVSVLFRLLTSERVTINWQKYLEL